MMTLVEGPPAPNIVKKVLVPVLGYTVFFYFFFLIFNTSFSFMGVDIGDYLKQYLGAFFGVYLQATFLVFASSFIFHSFVAILFHLSLFHFQSKTLLLILYLFLVDVIGFFHSVITYPQVYGEFFFYRQTWAVEALYFLTDHFSPQFFIFLLITNIGVSKSKCQRRERFAASRRHCK